MSDHDLLGFLASSLVLASFGMRDMLSLRLLALASNVTFISYGHLAHILPVMLLHSVLLPINLCYVLPMLRRAGARWLATVNEPRLPGLQVQGRAPCPLHVPLRERQARRCD